MFHSISFIILFTIFIHFILSRSHHHQHHNPSYIHSSSSLHKSYPPQTACSFSTANSRVMHGPNLFAVFSTVLLFNIRLWSRVGPIRLVFRYRYIFIWYLFASYVAGILILDISVICIILDMTCDGAPICHERLLPYYIMPYAFSTLTVRHALWPADTPTHSKW